MTKEFMKKILKNKSVDTKMYRYMVKEKANEIQICRVALDALGTTAACDYASATNPDGWKVMIALTMEDVERALA